MYLHSDPSVMKKHCREQIADWARENKVHNWEKIYEANHPREIERRKKYGMRIWNNNQKPKERFKK